MTDEWILQIVSPWGYRHPQLVARVRTVVGIWLLTLTAILYGTGRGGWWGVLLVPSAALCWFLAYREPRVIRARQNAADAANPMP